MVSIVWAISTPKCCNVWCFLPNSVQCVKTVVYVHTSPCFTEKLAFISPTTDNPNPNLAPWVNGRSVEFPYCFCQRSPTFLTPRSTNTNIGCDPHPDTVINSSTLKIPQSSLVIGVDFWNLHVSCLRNVSATVEIYTNPRLVQPKWTTQP